MNYRINPDILLQVVKSNTYRNFYVTENDTQHIEFNESILSNTVWNSGIYSGRLNKVFNSSNLINSASLDIVESKIQNCSLLLKQGFSWKGVFGILIVVKGMVSGSTYISRILNINDFMLNAEISRELIDNAFWTSEVLFNIPRKVSDENLMFSIEPIPFIDVISEGATIGLITSYPFSDNNFESLVNEAPLPSYIDVSLSIEDTQYIHIQPVTLEDNKTLEQSLIDYFGLTKNIVPIEISHIVKYGNDIDGYKSIRISNEDNTFNAVSVGLDFRQQTSTTVLIFVSTEFVVNNILLKRENSLLMDYSTIINPILNDVIVKNTDITVFPVNVNHETIVQNTIIQQDTETKIVTISQPVYVEISNNEIVFENKNISFNDVLEQSYLTITDSKSGKQQYIQSNVTLDNKYYFNLSSVIKPEKDSKFTVISTTNNNIIVKGKFIN